MRRESRRYELMEHLTSPKVIVGVHCLNLRHKGMYVLSTPYPEESQFYDPYDAAAYWCVKTQRGFGPDGRPVRPDGCQGERDCCDHLTPASSNKTVPSAEQSR